MLGSNWLTARVFAATLTATVCAAPALHAQQPTVRGTVIEAEGGAPVAGANVVVKGTAIGTAANERGEFTLRPRTANDTLVVSRIGFARQEVPLDGRTTVEIRLARTAALLSEVVTVGYGTQARSDITGSVASVSQDRLQEKPNTSIAEALQGAAPGVTVTTSSAGAEPGLGILIRGRNSISASTSPLIIVDGIPYSGSLAELNTNDVASIDVLKDASATAIYGSRGSNGVILITTQKGATGKAVAKYSGYVGTQTVSNLPRLMNAQEFAAFKCVRIRTTAGQDCATTLTATEQRNLTTGMNTDWASIGTQRGFQQQHDLSISGGNEDTRYFLDGAVLNVKGVARNDQFDRQTVRFNLDQKVRSWVSLGTNTQLARTTRSGVPVNFETAFFSNPLISPYDSAGNQVRVPWPEDPVTNNALENLLAQDDDVNKRVFSSNYLLVTIPRVSGLTYRLNAGVDIADRNSASYFGRNTQTGFALGGSSNISNTRRNDWTLENVVRYNRVMGAHSLDLTGLYSRQSNALESAGSRGQGYPNDVLAWRSALALLVVPASNVTESNLLSQMARVNYGYDERYLLTLTARRDGYSGFGRNSKYGVFPSLAVAWNASNERFFPWKDAVDALKIRFSYGRNGNQAIQPYQTLSQLGDLSYLNGDVSAPGYVPVTLGNPNLRWESTLSTNLGADLSLWKGRVSVTLDAYSAHTSDLLLRRSISSVQGISTLTQNIGKTANRGVELSLSTVNVKRAALEWRTDLNLAANRNKIVDLYGDRKDDIASGWFIGRPVDVNYGYQFDGVWQVADSASGTIAKSAQPTARPGYVKIKDVNGDNVIDPNDRTFIGNLEPKYTAGFSNSIRSRGVTLSAFFNTVQGVTRSNILLGTNQVFSDVRRNTLFREYWTPTNGINNYPSNSNNSNPLSVPFYEDASFIRLKDVTLSYDLPARITRRLSGGPTRVYVNGRNLWTHTNWSGLDPELNSQRAIPLQKIVTGGLTVRF